MRTKPGQRRALAFAGYTFQAGPDGTTIDRSYVDVRAAGDYGCDPVGDGTYRMIPSGDVVDATERDRRLAKK